MFKTYLQRHLQEGNKVNYPVLSRCQLMNVFAAGERPVLADDAIDSPVSGDITTDRSLPITGARLDEMIAAWPTVGLLVPMTATERPDWNLV